MIFHLLIPTVFVPVLLQIVSIYISVVFHCILPVYMPQWLYPLKREIFVWDRKLQKNVGSLYRLDAYPKRWEPVEKNSDGGRKSPESDTPGKVSDSGD